MPEESGPHLFFDTCTLSNFALAGRLDLLTQRYGRRAQVTPEVLAEAIDGIVAGCAELRTVEDAATAGRLTLADVLSAQERQIYRGLLRVLSPGEAACISCAKSRGGLVVTDDMTARQCCTENGVECTGTIGILKACVLDGTISPREADEILQTMIEAGYFSPVSRVNSIL